MSRRARFCLVAISGFVFVQAAASLLLRSGFALTAASDLIQSALLLAGTLAFLTNALATRGRTRLFWLLMSLGLAFWFAYQTLLWTYFEVFLRQDVPDVFWGDVILFLHIVPMMAALVLQPHAEQDERTTRLGLLGSESWRSTALPIITAASKRKIMAYGLRAWQWRRFSLCLFLPPGHCLKVAPLHWFAAFGWC